MDNGSFGQILAMHGNIREMAADVRHIRTDIDELKELIPALTGRVEKLERLNEQQKGKLAGFIAASTMAGSGILWVLERIFL